MAPRKDSDGRNASLLAQLRGLIQRREAKRVREAEMRARKAYRDRKRGQQ